MAGLSDVRAVGEQIVGPICGNRARKYEERDVCPMVHAYLLGRYSGVKREVPVWFGASKRYIDFRFGDWGYGNNPCVFELAVRGCEGGAQLSASQNRPELQKLSRFPPERANGGRFLLLLDLHLNPILESELRPGYDSYYLGKGKYLRQSVSVCYVHRDLHYRVIWKPLEAQS